VVNASPRLTVDLPRGFAGLTVGDSAAGTEGNVRDLARRFAVHSGQNEDRATRGLGVLAALMAPRGVRLFGRFAVGDPPVLATLALAVVPVSAPVKETVLVERYRERHPHAWACLVALPIGPAMVAVTAGSYQGTVERQEFTLESRVPVGSHVVVLTVTTADERGWPAVATEAMRVAGSLSVTPGKG
jgi:hypothetical protein